MKKLKNVKNININNFQLNEEILLGKDGTSPNESFVTITKIDKNLFKIRAVEILDYPQDAAQILIPLFIYAFIKMIKKHSFTYDPSFVEVSDSKKLQYILILEADNINDLGIGLHAFYDDLKQEKSQMLDTLLN